MEERKLFSSLIMILILFSLFGLNHFESVYSKTQEIFEPFSLSALIEHGSITIEFDENFTDYGFLGQGIESDPFRIDGYNITTTNQTGIYIFNTTKHFTISNCYVNALDMGIYIDQVADGTASIFNTTCFDNDDYGIRIENTTNSTVINVICDDNYAGIRIHTASDLFLKNASVLNCRYGISIWYSLNSVVIDCVSCYTTSNPGIYLSGSNSSILENNILNFNDPHGLQITRSGDCKIINNTCNFNEGNGIYLHRSYNQYVVNNTANNNEYDGFHFALYSNTTVVNNSCINSGDRGIMLYDCDDCFIYRNLIQNSVNYGLFVGGSRNTIHHNAFVNNNIGGTSQACEVDFETDNIWYDILTNEGNYWNTWGGTGDYVIDSNEYISDPYPLSTVPPDFPTINEFVRNAFCMFLPVFICVIIFTKKERRKGS